MPSADNPVEKFINADTLADAERVVQQHPELLDPRMVPVFKDLATQADNAYKDGGMRSGYERAAHAETAARRIKDMTGK